MLNEKMMLSLCDPNEKHENLYLCNQGGIISESGTRYEVNNGIPNLVKVTNIQKNQYAVNLFSQVADGYDEYHYLSYTIFNSDEEEVRNSVIDKLHIDNKNNIKVLELSAGTGRDSVLIKKRMTDDSELHVQDISFDMLNILKGKFNDDEIFITQSNAEALPYKDNTFDAIYSYGGIGMDLYADLNKQMQEISRVAKRGAKVVLVGLGVGPWLYKTEFATILINHNEHYMNKLDLSVLPIEARNVNISWILNGAVYCIEFEIGEGEPEANFDFEIPGIRGGSLRSRYYGKLEGVSPEVKRMAYEAREKLGISMYDFLNEVIGSAAKKVINE